MTMKLYSDTDIQAIANAIRTKNGSSDTYTVSDMAQAITDISTGGIDTLAERCNGTLTSYYSEEITTVSHYAFSGSGIQSLELPNCSTVGQNGLRGLTSLTDLKIHNTTRLLTDALNGSTAISVLAIPKCSSITTRSFNNNTNLRTLEIGVVGSQLSAVQITTLILRKSSVIALSAISNLNSRVWGESGTGGSLYVPQALISSYQSATNWATILGYTNNQILPIEGSQYENYYADGTPISN